MGTRVYAYGLGPLPRETRLAIREQTWLAYQYRVRLWMLTLAQRAAYRAARAETCPELVEAEAAFERAAEIYQLLREEAPKGAATREAKVALQHARAKARELRAAAKESPELQARASEIHSRHGELQRGLRAAYSAQGLYWGTYLLIEAAARSAAAGTEDPQRPRWRGGDTDGDGAVGIHFSQGVSVLDVMRGVERKLAITPPPTSGSKLHKRRTAARWRLCMLSPREPVELDLPVMLHRQLPADGTIKSARILVRRIWDHRYEYSLQVTVQSESVARRGEGAGVVAVCLSGDTITWSCEYGEPQTLEIDLRPQKIRDLQSIRDQHRNEAIGLLSAWCERQDETADWIRDEIAAIQERKSCRRLYHLRNRLREIVDDRLMVRLDKWAYREDHLCAWQSCQRTNSLRMRREKHRLFAAELRRKFRTCVIDSRRLDDPKRMTADHRDLGLHELRLTLKNAFGEDAASATGITCAELCEQYRGSLDPAPARDAGEPNDSATVAKPKRAKRTGFARKHAERKEAARKALTNAAE